MLGIFRRHRFETIKCLEQNPTLLIFLPGKGGPILVWITNDQARERASKRELAVVGDQHLAESSESHAFRNADCGLKHFGLIQFMGERDGANWVSRCDPLCNRDFGKALLA